MTHRVIQIYRGTTAQNDAFTGAAGELTMDTTTNELRLHDGSTVGGHIIGSGGSGSGYHPDLFDHKWADHELDDMQWLRADTFSWHYGSTSDPSTQAYAQAYQHLVDDLGTPTTYYSWTVNGEEVYTTSRTPQNGDIVYVNNFSDVGWLDSYNSGNDSIFFVYGSRSYTASYVSIQTEYSNATRKTETIAGITITYYLAADGHKICLADQESNVAAIYSATGVAWYYIVDTTNQRFKLPRTTFGFTGLRDTVGNYVAPALPNHTHDVAYRDAGTTGGVLNGVGGGNVYFGDRTVTSTGASDSTYQNGATVQPPATQMYLYFYVGSFTQTALENTAGLNAELFNGKLDLDAGNATQATKETIVGWGMPDTTAGINIGGSATYTFASDGWLIITTNAAGSVQFTSNLYDIDTYSPFIYGCLCPSGSAFAGFYPVHKNEVVTKTYSTGNWKAMFYPMKGV